MQGRPKSARWLRAFNQTRGNEETNSKRLEFYAERRKRAIRQRCRDSAADAGGCSAGLRRASRYNCSASAAAEAKRCWGSFAKQVDRTSSTAPRIEPLMREGGSGIEDSTWLQTFCKFSPAKGDLPVSIS